MIMQIIILLTTAANWIEFAPTKSNIYFLFINVHLDIVLTKIKASDVKKY